MQTKIQTQQVGHASIKYKDFKTLFLTTLVVQTFYPAVIERVVAHSFGLAYLPGLRSCSISYKKKSQKVFRENANSISKAIKEQFHFLKYPSNVSKSRLTANNFFQTSPKDSGISFCASPEKHQFDNMLIRMTNMQKSPPEETPRLMTVDSVGDKKNAKGAGKII